MGPVIKITEPEGAALGEPCGIVHDYGLITLLGGVESIIRTYTTNQPTLHFIVVTQDQNESFWNELRRRKIRKILGLSPHATIILIPALVPLPRTWHRLPNWMTVRKNVLHASYDIGKQTAKEFVTRFEPLLTKHRSH
jgi:hypothetical protein